jgi:hypothetical protein
MTKDNSPVDVTLNKSTSGTWRASKPSGFHLKPWQRLWVASGVVYLLIVAGSYHLLIPDRERIERKMVFAVVEEVRRYDGMAFAGESPRKVFEVASSKGYSAWIAQVRSKYRIGSEGNAGFTRIEKEYRDDLIDLPMKRIAGVLISVFAWLVPMGVFYAIGSVIDWIRRGASAAQR